ncbi:MAG: ribosome biogenesis factor YjgA [Halioglobus sp.]
MPDFLEEEGLERDDAPSKSARKRHMLALQAIGESLLNLSEKQLAQIPIDDERLLATVREARLIHSKSARKRHLQFIGKLMRDIDPAPIEQALRQLDNVRQQHADAFHQLEQLRAAVLEAGPGGVELVMTRYPAADRQQLRQLVLQHQREAEKNKPPAASRKLFRYLKELQQDYGDTG